MHGLFIGLTTLDLIYRADHPPATNQKLVASDYTVSAGGPATNAAVAFAHLGDRATVLSVLGAHPLTHLIQADLAACHVRLMDLQPQRAEPPPVSSIIVTEATGERAVISINAVKTQASPEQLPANLLDDVNLILIDGHQMQIGQAIAQQAKARNISIVVDGGSWKPGFEAVLLLADYVICSANFYPSSCQNRDEVMAFLQNLGIPHIAITQGGSPIQYCDRTQTGEISVPTIQPIDTLGAGDIFHGAFCHYILQLPFIAALEKASHVAAHSCQFFGTRRWLKAYHSAK